MRTWALLVVGGATAGLAAAIFGACSGPGPAPGGPQPVGAKPPNASHPADPRDAGTRPATSQDHPGARPGDGGPVGATPSWQAVQRCSTPQTVIVNQPDGGVVFNNAMTSADAGFIDRTQGIIDSLIGESGKLRCCLDSWTRQRPGVEGRLMLVLEVDPGGKAISARIDGERSNLADNLAVPCVIDVATQARYPASPTGSVTVVEYPIVFVAAER